MFNILISLIIQKNKFAYFEHFENRELTIYQLNQSDCRIRDRIAVEFYWFQRDARKSESCRKFAECNVPCRITCSISWSTNSNLEVFFFLLKQNGLCDPYLKYRNYVKSTWRHRLTLTRFMIQNQDGGKCSWFWSGYLKHNIENPSIEHNFSCFSSRAARIGITFLD